MIAPTAALLEILVTAHVRRRPLALVFDYDGTLTPMVAHPRLARLAPTVRRLLQDLARLPRVTVGVVSGRMLDDVRRQVDLSELYYGGTCGLELDLRGVRRDHPDAVVGRQLVAGAAERLTALTRAWPGAWVEVKPLGLTLHYRQVAPTQHRALCSCARQLFRPAAASWRLVDGACALEAMPALGWTKASALQAIQAEAGVAALPFYAGDESNDADALAAVAAASGVAVGVGPRAPVAATHRLAAPRDLERLLRRLLTALSPPSPRGRLPAQCPEPDYASR